MNRPGLILSLVLSATCLSSVEVAPASPAAETRYLDERARWFFAQGDYDSALSMFLEVYRATPSAEGAYNVAVCAQLAQRRRLAFEFLAEVVRLAPRDHPLLGDVKERTDVLSKDLALVHVESTPPGATIYVDRKELGAFGQTPRTIAVDRGTREISLSLDGYQETSADIFARNGETQRVSTRLVAEVGTLEVVANVPNAEVRIEGRNGSMVLTPGKNEVRAGALLVTVRARGYHTVRERLTLAAHDDRTLKVRLRKLPPPTGKLLIETDGASAKLFINGKFRGQTPATVPSLPVGVHRLRLEAPEGLRRELDVEVQEGQTTYRRVLLPKTSVRPRGRFR